MVKRTLPSLKHTGLSLLVVLPLAGLLAASALPTAAPKPPTADAAVNQVFEKRCASCHGPAGKGTKSYAKPLAGTKSVGELATFIARSMPPGASPKLPAAQAKAVAAYIHGAFYSPIAQSRNKPARVELSRLTVGQYRGAVLDLIRSFRDTPKIDGLQGLHGVYFKGGRGKLQERLDPAIRFNFGDKGAIPEQDDPYQFSMIWDGSVMAPDTGEYEFIVRTDQAARCWVNDLRRPLIDAYVKSGDTNEYRGVLYLVGGRAYPIKLEFSKGVVGVNDLAKVKAKPPQKAFISLEWKRPKLAAEVIPQRNLLPVTFPEAFPVSTPFPPDDRSLGYERGTSISKAWDEAATDGAIETARYVLEHLRELSGVVDDAADRPARLNAFCRKFVERAFRRPLTDDLAKTYVDKQFAAAKDPETAVKRVVLLTLKSPRFLYREVGSPSPDAYDVASRLSFGLWDSLPDAELMKAASEGKLTTREQVSAQAERMLADVRAHAKLRDFFLRWLKVDQTPEIAKDKKLFPGFDDTVASDLRTSLELSLESIAWSEKSDFRDLMLSDTAFLNGRLAKLYNVSLPDDAPFQPEELDDGERAGILTHPYVLSTFAYIDSTSPIHRGVLIARNMLGRVLQPPPAAFTPLPASSHPKLTTRQRVAMQTKPAACNSCHSMINPLGFALERYDAIGRLRAEENGMPVDASGGYVTRSGKAVRFGGAKDLARFLAESDESHAAFVEKLFHHLVKQPVLAYGPNTLPDLQKRFEANQFNMKKLMVEIVTVAALKR